MWSRVVGGRARLSSLGGVSRSRGAASAPCVIPGSPSRGFPALPFWNPVSHAAARMRGTRSMPTTGSIYDLISLHITWSCRLAITGRVRGRLSFLVCQPGALTPPSSVPAATRIPAHTHQLSMLLLLLLKFRKPVIWDAYSDIDSQYDIGVCFVLSDAELTAVQGVDATNTASARCQPQPPPCTLPQREYRNESCGRTTRAQVAGRRTPERGGQQRQPPPSAGLCIVLGTQRIRARRVAARRGRAPVLGPPFPLSHL